MDEGEQSGVEDWGRQCGLVFVRAFSGLGFYMGYCFTAAL